MLSIIEVTTKKQRREFIEYPLRLYAGNPYFVPSLYGDEMTIFTKKNVYFNTCDSCFFLAEREGKTVGRIQGIIQKQFNALHDKTQVRFTRFDCEENPETAKALFAAVEAWAKEKGMTEMVGPLGYSDLEREGLLIEGFDYLSTYEEQYNYPYYASLIESYGFEKDVDWVEFRLFKKGPLDERLKALADRALKRHNLHIAGEKMSKGKFLKKYADGIFECIDECYKELYGVVPFTPEMIKQTISQFKLLLNKKYIMAICDQDEKVVAFGFCVPGFGKALQKSGGRLTLPTLFRLLKEIRRPSSVDLALIGVLPKYRNSGLTAFAMILLQDILESKGVEYLETNLNLETNANIQAQWKHFDFIQHKRRRSYIKKFD